MINFDLKNLTISEVSKILGISRSTIYRARKKGLLTAQSRGRFVRFDTEEIDKLRRRWRR